MRSLTNELIKLSEQTKLAHDSAIDCEFWETATELRKLGDIVAVLIAKSLRVDVAEVAS